MTAVLPERPLRPAADDPRAASWALVERAQAGDRDAFGQLYSLYRPLVARVVLRRVGHRQTAEDITSETFTRALGSIHRLTWQGRDVAAWLTTIARNLIADHFKSGRYRLEVTTGEPGADQADQHGGADDQALADLAGAELRRLIEQLQPTHRRCVELHCLGQRSIAETAADMGKTPGAVKALTQRAIWALARLYAAREANPWK